jgi:hypothetical protein
MNAEITDHRQVFINLDQDLIFIIIFTVLVYNKISSKTKKQL